MISLIQILKEVYSYSENEIERDDNDNLLSIEYIFKTDKNRYKVILNSFEKPRVYEVEFGVDKGEGFALDTKEMTGEGNTLGVLKTVSNIINDFLEDYTGQYDKLVISGTDEKRSRVYKLYFPKRINPKYLSKVEIK